MRLGPVIARLSRHQRAALGVGEHLRRIGLLTAVHLDQVGAHLRGRLIPVVGVLGQRLEHDGVKLGGDALVTLRRGYRIFADVLICHCDGRITNERWLAGEHFVQHAAQRVHVGAGVDLLTARLFGGEILRGADHGRGLGDVAGIGERARDAEVHHLHRAGVADHDVRGFDVAVDDPVLVAEVQRLARIGDDLDGPARLHRPVGVHDVAQRDAFDVLHHDVGQGTVGGLGLTGVVDRHDGGVVQRCGVLRLAAEPQVEARIAGQIRAQHLDRHVAVQPLIARQMDFGHAAEAQDVAEFVPVGQVLRGCHCHVCSGVEGRWPSGSVSGSVTCAVAGDANALIRVTPNSAPPSRMASCSVRSGIAVGENGVVSVMVLVIVGDGVCSWSLRSWAFSTMSIAMTIARAPSTPAAHSSAR